RALVAGSISHEVGGEQYIAIHAGWGGGAAQIEQSAGIELPRSTARLLVFKLGGNKQLPALAARAPVTPPPALRASEAQIARGAQLYAETCAVCHGQSAIGGVKDLRHMTPEVRAQFNDIVLKGTFVDKGMGNFSDLLNQQQTDDIYGYLVARANEDWGR